jgi:hypothetical protein
MFVPAEDGTFCVGTDHADAVFLVRADGAVEPPYKDILLFNSGLPALGNGHYL